jgi:nucleoside-triphosphatase
MDDQGRAALPPATICERVAALPPGARWLGILTGGRGAGKSTWCAALAQAARARGLSVGGVLSRAVFDDERLPVPQRIKLRIDLVDLATGDTRVLATPGDAAAEGHGLRWHFYDEAIAWGNGALEANAALEANGAEDGAHLVIIDELGPLELTHARGLTAGLALLDKGAYRAAVVVIRPELLEAAVARWPGAEVVAVPAWKGVRTCERERRL